MLSYIFRRFNEHIKMDLIIIQNVYFNIPIQEGGCFILVVIISIAFVHMPLNEKQSIYLYLFLSHFIFPYLNKYIHIKTFYIFDF